MRKIPLRKCLATNEQLPKKELIRVVRNKEGQVFVDATGKKNGRAPYLTRSLEAIEISKKKKVLSRSLQVEIPDEIFEELKNIVMNKKYLNLLGLAYVAKGIVSGETLIKSIAANETKLVVIANDASANTKKKITDKCHFYHVDYFIVDENIETISKAVGKNNRVALGITNQGFAKKIKELIGG